MEVNEFYISQLLPEKELYKLQNQLAKIKVQLPPDPATIYQAYQTGKTIYNLFKKQKGKKDELMYYLKAEIAIIKQLLKDVLQKLEELKVFIAEQSRLEAVNNLESIQRIFQESYDTWWRYPRRDDVKKEVSEVSIRLKEYNRVAQKHGFAHYHTIWISIIYELMLLEYFDRPAKERKQILGNHADYFNEAQRAEVPGSIKFAVLSALHDIQVQSNLFPPSQFHNDYGREIRSCYYTYRQTLTVTGSLTEGFKFSYGDPVQTGRSCESPAGGGGRGGGPRFSLIAPQSAEVDLTAIAARYTAARNHYLQQLLPKLQDITLALENCQYFEAELRAAAKLLK